MDKIELFDIAIEAAMKAGDAILEIYRSNSLSVENKSDNSPLTKADIESNNTINTYLKKTAVPIISEENKIIPFNERKEWNACWIVDPLDGTKEFIKRNGEFTVNIAFCQEGKPTFGVIYVPVSRELYVGDVEQGVSYKVIVDKTSKQLFRQLTNDNRIFPKGIIDSKSLKVVGSRSHMNSETQEFIDELEGQFDQVEIVSKGSSLKFCMVAEGKAQIYPRFAPTMEWDTAAGHAICKAVGLKVISTNNGQELTYNKQDFLNDYFIVER